MGAIAAVSSLLASNALLEQSLERIQKTTAGESARIDGWIEGQKRYISAISADFAYLPGTSSEQISAALAAHFRENEQFSEVYIGYPDGTGDFSSGWTPDYEGGWASYKRSWYIGAAQNIGEPFVTTPYTDAITGNLCVAVSQAVVGDSGLVGVVSADIFIDVLQEIVTSTTIGQDSYAFLTDASGSILIHPNAAYSPDENDNFQNIAQIENGVYANLWQKTTRDGAPVQVRSADGTSRYYTARTIPAVGWKLYTAIPSGVVRAPIRRQITTAALMFVLVLAGAAALIYLTVKRIIVTPIHEVTEAARLLAQGDTDITLSNGHTGEIGHLMNSFGEMATLTQRQVNTLEQIAAGDLSADVTHRGERDQMGAAMQQMLDKLNEFFSGIRNNATQVARGSSQIADGAQSLAHGSTQQAASVEQLSSSVNEIAHKTQENARKATKASELSDIIRTNAQKGTEQMNQMMQAVREIGEASQNISRVIKVIDDIAFQTNILALNAAVEAARAGQHGKGFAVVAEEVRNLAAKSAEAAKDTGKLIANSMEKAELGARIADDTSASLHEIVSGINESTEIIQEIAVSSEEQAAGIQQINTNIGQVAQVVQQNSATAEESASASAEMNGLSEILNELVARFTLRNQNGPHPALRGETPARLPVPPKREHNFGKY
jgi:methyl-accepting chemotaxis protein